MHIWLYDLAREQSPTLEHLEVLCRFSLEAGYSGLGLYLEHRFAYPSVPWAHGSGAVPPEWITHLQREFPTLQLIPFINLLGHMEGFLYTEHGKRFREAKFAGLQACASHPELMAMCEGIIDDTCSIFNSELIHIGGDETAQLGACDLCKERVETWNNNGLDGKAKLYGSHFGSLAQRVVNSGRRPGLWGDMFIEHPSALDFVPKESLLFDWQYFNGLTDSTPKLQARGMDVVGCPALHTYNALWLHLEHSEANIEQVVADGKTLGTVGTCVTTWECALFGAYDSLFPALRGAARILRGEPAKGQLLAAYEEESADFSAWAMKLGIELERLGGVFGLSRLRSSLKVRLLLQANPFLAWLHHGDELFGERGNQALTILEQALQDAPNESAKGITRFARGAIEFVRLAELAHQAYGAGYPEKAIAFLTSTRPIFDDLEGIARRTHVRIGGSLADRERCLIARRHVEVVINRIRHYGDGSLGYLPSFEQITHPKFTPHDQGAWWLINKFAHEG